MYEKAFRITLPKHATVYGENFLTGLWRLIIKQEKLRVDALSAKKPLNYFKELMFKSGF